MTHRVCSIDESSHVASVAGDGIVGQIDILKLHDEIHDAHIDTFNLIARDIEAFEFGHREQHLQAYVIEVISRNVELPEVGKTLEERGWQVSHVGHRKCRQTLQQLSWGRRSRGVEEKYCQVKGRTQGVGFRVCSQAN